MWGIGCFYHKKWYGGMYGLGVFKEDTIQNNNLHGEK